MLNPPAQNKVANPSLLDAIQQDTAEDFDFDFNQIRDKSLPNFTEI